jgi:hypothetical protein
MDLNHLKYPKVPDPNKTSYLVYSPGSTRRFRTYPDLKQPKAAVTRKRNKCSQWNYEYYYNNRKPASRGQYTHLVDNFCALIFKSEGDKWVLMPELSFAVSPIDGYPIIAHQNMYHIPIAIKPKVGTTLNWSKYYAMNNSLRKKVRIESHIWYPVKKLVEGRDKPA